MASWHSKKLGGLEITEAGDIETAKDKSQHSAASGKVAQVCMQELLPTATDVVNCKAWLR
jgi:hypothetical protein